MSNTQPLTDRTALDLHRARALRAPAEFLQEAVAVELEERLNEVNKVFRRPLLIGHFMAPLRALFPAAPVIADADRLDVLQQDHDLAIHAFGLHWADDPVGQMVQSRLTLKPDGLFLGVMFGGATLQELRTVLAETETRMHGGLSPRVLPMGDIRDLGGLLQRAGFALPVADSRKLKVRYPSFTSLVRDLRGMGETNALAQRNRKTLTKGFWQTVEAMYQEYFSDGSHLLATFELVYLTGWAPAESQQKPLRPGSAKTRLSDALNVKETSMKRE
ncbi:MAG: SAM-dependent methyltransferase [Pseudomonadota bacterium]